jgi:octaprenyl-diphosphate synthase
MSHIAGAQNTAKLQADQISIATYRLIETRVLPGLNWSTFSGLLKALKERGSTPPYLYTDIFPALACQGAGGDPLRAVPLAAAWLLNTLAGRIFDDRQDGEGAQHLWMRGGATDATSIGLFALGAANAALSHLLVKRETFSDIVCAFGNILALSAKAQTEKLDLAGLTVERYFANIAAKTGIVFATAAWVGARTAEESTSDSTIGALYDFGMNLGMAIQIADDCVDLRKSDLRRQHFTLPVVFALSQSNHSHHPTLVSLLANGLSENWDEDVIDLLEEMGAIDWSLNVASVYRAKAIAALEPLPRKNVAALIAYAAGEHEYAA